MDISIDKVSSALMTKDFPMRVPVNMDAVLSIAQNPVLKKMFGKKVDDAAKRAIVAAINM